MEYRTLASTDLRVSRLCMGTMTYGSQVGEQDAERMTARCLDAGINFFDTANVYNEGRSEEILGRCLAGRRQDIVLASKARGEMEGPPPYSGLSRDALRRAIEESLRRLQTDYLDIYYLHQPDDSTPIEETLETMQRLHEEGKVRYPATSNYSSWQICEMLTICERKGWQAPRICQPMYNVLARGIEQEFIPFTKRFDVSLVVYNPLAGGLLTGKHSQAQGPLAGSRFDNNERYQQRYWHWQYFEAVEALQRAANEHGRSLLEVALRWLLDQDVVPSVILGASKLEQLEANLVAAGAAPLSPGLREACDQAWQELRGPTPAYNR